MEEPPEKASLQCTCDECSGLAEEARSRGLNLWPVCCKIVSMGVETEARKLNLFFLKSQHRAINYQETGFLPDLPPARSRVLARTKKVECALDWYRCGWEVEVVDGAIPCLANAIQRLLQAACAESFMETGAVMIGENSFFLANSNICPTDGRSTLVLIGRIYRRINSHIPHDLALPSEAPFGIAHLFVLTGRIRLHTVSEEHRAGLSLRDNICVNVPRDPDAESTSRRIGQAIRQIQPNGQNPVYCLYIDTQVVQIYVLTDAPFVGTPVFTEEFMNELDRWLLKNAGARVERLLGSESTQTDVDIIGGQQTHLDESPQ